MSGNKERGRIAISVLNLAESSLMLCFPEISLTPKKIKDRMRALGYKYIQGYPLRGHIGQNARDLKDVTLVAEDAWYGPSRWNAFHPERIKLDGWLGLKSFLMDFLLFPGRAACLQWRGEMKKAGIYESLIGDSTMPGRWNWTMRRMIEGTWEISRVVDLYHLARNTSLSPSKDVLGAHLDSMKHMKRNISLVYFHTRDREELESFLDGNDSDDYLTQTMSLIYSHNPEVDIVVKIDPGFATNENLIRVRERLKALRSIICSREEVI